MSGQPVDVRDQDDVVRSLGWFAPAWENAPAAIVLTLGPEHRLAYQNAASRALFGSRPAGMPIREAFPTGDGRGFEELDRALATGRVVSGERRPVGVRDFDGGEVHLRYVLTPFGPPGEPSVGVVVSAVDLTGEARAELASNRARLLTRLTERLNLAGDPAAALQALTDVLVPELADVAAVYVLPEEGGPERLPRGPVAPEAVAVAPELARLGPPPTSSVVRQGMQRWDEVFASGLPVLIPYDAEVRALVAPDDAVRAWLTAAGVHNLVAVPLAAAGRLIGGIVLVCAGERRPYTEAILPFLTDVAARAGVAVAQVRQHRRQAEVSHRLQQALLPAAPPRVPGLQVAARYLAGAPEVDVGGDWWDVVQVDDRHVAIGVGDVSGRGVDAAIVMGHARAAMRTASLTGLPPERVLDLLDRQLRDLVADGAGMWGAGPQFATALHAVLDLATGRTRLACAGHPAPLVHLPDGTVRQVPVPAGPPLGLGEGGHRESVLELPPGGSLLLFTDGLVEDRSRDLDVGLADLARQLAAHADRDVADALDGILAALGAGGSGHPVPAVADDVAVVLVRRELPRD